MSSTREEEVFEIRIDGKLVCTKKRGKPGVFLHMETFDQVRLTSFCLFEKRRPLFFFYSCQPEVFVLKLISSLLKIQP